jgi:hypothetical protein
MTQRQFPPSVKKGKLCLRDGSDAMDMYDIPDGIIAHLTKKCGGKVRDPHAVEVASGPSRW